MQSFLPLVAASILACADCMVHQPMCFSVHNGHSMLLRCPEKTHFKFSHTSAHLRPARLVPSRDGRKPNAFSLGMVGQKGTNNSKDPGPQFVSRHVLQQFESCIIRPALIMAASALLLWPFPSSTLSARELPQVQAVQQETGSLGRSPLQGAMGGEQQVPKVDSNRVDQIVGTSPDSSGQSPEYDVLVRKMRCKEQGQEMCYDALVDKLLSTDTERQARREANAAERDAMNEISCAANQNNALRRNKRLILEAWDIIHRVCVRVCVCM
jgi:hypothetical protein